MADWSRSDRRPVLDSGLQAERTRLAWSRTALSFGAVGALMLHTGMSSGNRTDELPGLIALCSAAATYLLGVGRYHTTNREVSCGRPPSAAAAIRALTALTTVTVVLALVLIST